MMNLLLSLLLGNFEICALITRFKEEDKLLRRIENKIIKMHQKLKDKQSEEGSDQSMSSNYFSDDYEDLSDQSQTTKFH